MKKINAYTLMEVTVAMLLSAIVISICYAVYGIIGNYYANFSKKNETADAVLSIRHVLEKDFLRSTHVLKTEEGLTIEGDSLNIFYAFTKSAILRKFSTQHTDTFKLVPQDIKYFFEGNEILDPDTIDQVKFLLELDKNQIVPIQITKTYSAQDLFH